MARSDNRGSQGGLWLAVAGLLLAGCVTEGSRSGGGFGTAQRGGPDPLLGGGTPIEAVSRDRVTGGSTSTGSTNPAALASGSFSPLDPGRPLHIDTPLPQPKNNDWRGPEPTRSEPSRSERIEPVPTVRGAPPSFEPTPGLRVASYEQAQSLLKSRGVTWQRLETIGDEGEWKFSCRIPKPNNPHMARTYEAKANEPIAALSAVLDKIDRDR
jgi:hypothetical protein